MNFISCGSTLFSKLSNPGSIYKFVTCYFVCWESLDGYFWRTARTRMKCCMVRNNIRVCAVCQDKDNIQIGLLMEISICYPSNKKKRPFCNCFASNIQNDKYTLLDEVEMSCNQYNNVCLRLLPLILYKLDCVISAAAEVTKSDMYPYQKGNK